MLHLWFMSCVVNIFSISNHAIKLSRSHLSYITVHKSNKEFLEFFFFFFFFFFQTVHLQWLEHQWLVYYGWVEIVFASLGNSSVSSRKAIFKTIWGNFTYLSWKCMLCLFIRIASKAILMNTLDIPFLYRRSNDIPKLSPFAYWLCVLINPQWLELPVSRTNIQHSDATATSIARQ